MNRTFYDISGLVFCEIKASQNLILDIAFNC